MQVKQEKISSNNIEHGIFSAFSKQSLLGNRTQYNTATTSTTILNCSELEPINSHGIGLLILLLIYTQRQRKRLLFFGLSEHNRYILQITRLNKFIDIADTTTKVASADHLT